MSLAACLCAQADTIVLKNGRRIVTSQVQEEGARVRYETEDGTYTLPRSLVERIEKGGEAPPPRAARRPDPAPTPSLPAVPTDLKVPVNADGRLNEAFFDDLYRRAYDTEAERTLAGNLFLAGTRYEMQQGRTESAMALARKALTALPGDARLALNYGVLLLTQQRAQEARDWLERAARGAPSSPDVFKFLGYAEYLLDRTPEAIRHWQKAMSLGGDREVKSLLERAERETQAELMHEQTASGHFTLRFEGGRISPEFRRDLFTALERHYSDLESQLGASLREPIAVILYSDQAFRDVTRSPGWVGAINDGRVRVPVEGLTAVTPELSRVLRHEIVHSFVWAKTRGRCPAWINEGLAQLIEGETVQRDSRLAELARSGQLLPLESLSGSFTRLGTGMASVAYGQSLLAVEFLVRRSGMAEMVRLLEQLGSGSAPEPALQSVFGMSYADLEREMTASLGN